MNVIMAKRLQNRENETITLPNGRKVTLDDITDLTDDVNCIGFIFLPSVDYLDDFLNQFKNEKLASRNKFM